MNVKTKKVIPIILLVVMIISIVGMVFAYYEVYYAGYKQYITTFNVFFKINDHSFTTVGQNDINLSRGEEDGFVMEVSATGTVSGSSVMEYSIGFTFNGDKTKAEAVDVYKLTDGKYEFFCRLSEIEDARLDDWLLINSTREYEIKLCYSEGAGDYYEDQQFSITCVANNWLSNAQAPASDKVYVSTETAFVNALNNSDNVGKKITFLNDISFSGSAFTTDNKMSIDLNGYNLELASSITLDYSYSTTECGIYSNSLRRTGTINKNGGSGKLIIGGSDVYFVGENLSASYNQITAPSFSDISTSLGSYISARAAILSDGIHLTGEELDLFDGLDYYFDKNVITVNYDSETVLACDTDNVLTIDSAVSTDVTVTYSENIQFAPVYPATGTPITQALNFIVRGNGAAAVGQSALAAVPSVIKSSIFLPSYDVASTCNITWVIEDENDGNLLNGNGVLLPNGYANLTDWRDRADIRIGIIVDDGAGTYYASKQNVSVQIYSAEERTEHIYNDNQMVLNSVYDSEAVSPDAGSYVDINSSSYMSNMTYVTYSYLKGITVAVGASIADSDDGTNTMATNTYYLEVLNSGDYSAYNRICVKNKPETATPVEVNCVLTFTYENNGEDISYSIEKVITILGSSATIDVNDPTVTLQPYFDNNAYLNGTGDDFSWLFDVIAAYESAGEMKYVEYTVNSPSNATGYVSVPATVTKSSFTQNSSGNFMHYVKDGAGTGVFAYISERYSYNTETQALEIDANGTYVLIKPQLSYDFDATSNRIKTFSSDGTTYKSGVYGLTSDANYQDAFDAGLIAGNYLPEWICNLYNTVTILPNNVPNYDVTVELTAKLYTLTDGGDKSYVLGSNNEPVSYDIRLSVRGLYHNMATEIPNINVYNTMLTYYDFNGDGYVGVAEAKTAWYTGTTCNLLTAPSVVSGLHYINLSNQQINSIKGLEYFTGAMGYDLSDNTIADISSFGNIRNLEYLDFENNLITNIDALLYLDNLSYISVKNNYVTNIESLRYLSSLSTVNLCGNNVADIDPLVEHTELTSLDLTDSSTNWTLQGNIYYIALIYSKNSGNSISIKIGDSATPVTWAPVANDKIIPAANALYELQKINEIYQTLYFPMTYTYKYASNASVSYILKWEVIGAEQSTYISFTNTSGSTSGYTITTPIVDLPLTIQVSVKESGGDYLSLSRTFKVTLLQSQSASSVLYVETSSGVYELASVVFPDAILRNLAFKYYNSESTADVTVADGVTVSDTYVLTQTELTASKTAQDMDWSNLGITNLTNISLISSIFSGSSLDLRYNVLTNADISPLMGLNIGTLYLAGQTYDFNQLVDTDGVGDDNSTTSLTSLYVNECYGVDSDAVIEGLYAVYIKNTSVSIYKDSSTTVWNPYALLLSKYVQGLPTTYTFMDYCSTSGSTLNNYVNFYAGSPFINTTGNGYEFEFYGKDVNFNISSVIFYERASATWNRKTNKSSFFKLKKSGSNYTDIGLTKMMGYDEPFYVKLILSYSDTHGTYTYDYYFAELLVYANYKIILVDNESGYNETSITELFSGRTLRTIVANSLTTNVFKNSSNSVGSIENLLGAATNTTPFYYADGYYYISKTTLKYMTIDGGAFAKGSKSVSGTSYDVYRIDGTYFDGGNALDNLNLIGNIKAIQIWREANLGTGESLTNLVALGICYSGVNFTTITAELPNLKLLYLGKTIEGTSKNNSNVYVILHKKGSTTLTTDFSANDLTVNTYSADITDGDFTVKATADNGVAVIDISAAPITVGDLRFTKELSLLGAGNANFRSVRFSTDRAATISISLSSGSGDSETLTLYKSNGVVVGSVAATSTPSVVSMSVYGCGTFYLASSTGAVKIYNITITENGDEYALSHMSALAEMQVLNSQVSDWEFLRGFLGNEDCYLKTLFIFGASNVYKPLVTSIMTKASTTLNLAINTTNFNYQFTSGTKYIPGTAGTPVSLTINPEKEYQEFAPKIQELGVKVGGNYYYLTANAETVTSGTTITLPATTEGFSFNATYNAQADYFERNFSVEWYILGVNTTSGCFTGTAINGDNNKIALSRTGSDITLTASAVTNDTYVVLVGVIGNGYYSASDEYSAFDTTQTKYSFVYPILIKANISSVTQGAGYYSMANFTDSAFRYLVFSKEYSTSAYSSGALVNANVTGTSSGTLDITAISPAFGYGSVRNGYTYSNVTSLSGIGVYNNAATAITSFTLNNALIYDLGNLSSLTSLASINLASNNISDVSSLKSLANVTSLNLSENKLTSLRSLFSINGSVVSASNLLSSLQVFYVDNNPLIGSETVTINGTDYLWDIYYLSRATNLTNLRIFNTKACKSYIAMASLNYLVDSLASDSLVIRMNQSASNVTVTKAALSAFVTQIGNNYAAYMAELGGTTNYQSLTIDSTVSGGYTYTAAFDSIFTADWDYGQSFAVPATITSSALSNELYIDTCLNYSNVSAQRVIIRVGSNGTNYYTLDSISATGYHTIEMDAKLWRYLIDNVVGQTAILGNYGMEYTLTNNALTIPANLGVTSLKGLQNFGFTSITVESGNVITELWSGTMTGLKTFALYGALQASDFNCLNNAGNKASITKLDLRHVSGLDYDAEVTSGTTLIALINSFTSITELDINNEYNLDMFGGTSARQSIINEYSQLLAANRIFTSSTLRTIRQTSVYSCYSTTVTRELTASAKAFLQNRVLSSVGKIYYADSGHGATYSSFTCDYKTDNVKYSALKQALNMQTAVGRTIIPSTNSYTDISAGVSIYLPKTISFMGVTLSMSYASTNSDRYLNTTKDEINITQATQDIATTSSFEITASASGVSNIVYGIEITNLPAADTNTLRQYYIEVEPGIWKDATTVFESGRLVDYIFREANNATYNSTTRRYEMSFTKKNAITSLTFDNKGITSLVGLNVFTNLTSLTINQGQVTSIEPLRGMALITFIYTNPTTSAEYASENLIINDFSPLYEGASRTTLQRFDYSYYGYSQITDLSFLTCFTNLTTVNLYLGATYARSYLTQYIESESFKYLVSYLSNNTNVKVNVPAGLIVDRGGTGANLPTSWLQSGTQLVPNASYKQAASVLENFGSGLSNYDGYFKLTYDTSAYFETNSSLTVYSGYAPSIIVDGGTPYLVHWSSASTYLAFSSNYTLVLSGGLSSITVNSVSYSNGDQISSAIAELITSEQVAAINSGNVNINCAFTVNMPTTVNLFDVLSTARIYLDGISYERMITFDLQAENDVLYQLSLKYKNLYKYLEYGDSRRALTALYNTAVQNVKEASDYSAKRAILDGADTIFAVTKTQDLNIKEYEEYRNTLLSAFEMEFESFSSVSTVYTDWQSVYNTYRTAREELKTCALVDYSTLALAKAALDDIYSTAIDDMTNATKSGYIIAFYDDDNNIIVRKSYNSAQTLDIETELGELYDESYLSYVYSGTRYAISTAFDISSDSVITISTTAAD